MPLKKANKQKVEEKNKVVEIVKEIELLEKRYGIKLTKRACNKYVHYRIMQHKTELEVRWLESRLSKLKGQIS